MSNGRVTAMRWTLLLGSLFGVTGWALFGAATARSGPEAVAKKHVTAWADPTEPVADAHGRELAAGAGGHQSGPGSASPFSSTMKRTEAPPQGALQPAGYPIAGGPPPATGTPPAAGTPATGRAPAAAAGRSYWPQETPNQAAPPTAVGVRPPVPAAVPPAPVQTPPFAPTDYPATAAAPPVRPAYPTAGSGYSAANSGNATNAGNSGYPTNSGNTAANSGYPSNTAANSGYPANAGKPGYPSASSAYPTANSAYPGAGSAVARPGAMPIPSVPPSGNAVPAAWTEPTAGRPAAPYADATVRPAGAVAAAADDDTWRDSAELKHLQLELRAAGAVFYRLERWGQPAQYRFVCRAPAADATGAVAEAEFESVADRPLAAIRLVLAQLLARRAGA